MISIHPTKKLRYNYKTEPFSHQKKALKKLLDLEGKGFLLMDMGTGKTKVAIDFASIGFHNWGVKRVLVVAPLSVLGVWSRQIPQHGGAPSRRFRLHGKTGRRIYMLKLLMRYPDNNCLTWVITNYEGIWREPDRGAGVKDLLIRWKPDVVIFDESHRLKSHTSKQSKAAAKIAEKAPIRLALTGTHITKSPLDVFGQFRAIDGDVFGKRWDTFRFYYGVWGGFHKYKLEGYHHLKELILKVRSHSFRIKKEQCLDLPPKLYETVPITIPDSIERVYKKMAEEMIVEIENTRATAAIVLVKLLRLSQITSGFVKDVEGNIRLLHDAKLQACLDIISDLLEGEGKVVVFVRFREDIRRLDEALTKRRISHGILSGSVPIDKRDTLIQKFHNDPDFRVFVAQVQAGSLGIDLTPASSAIFFSLDYNAANYWQAQDRLHRLGQTRKVTYYHLVVPHTIDQVVLDVLKHKGNLAETIIHKPRKLLGF